MLIKGTCFILTERVEVQFDYYAGREPGETMFYSTHSQTIYWGNTLNEAIYKMKSMAINEIYPPNVSLSSIMSESFTYLKHNPALKG